MCSRGQINQISDFKIKKERRNLQLQQHVAFGREVWLEKFFLSWAAHSSATSFAASAVEMLVWPCCKLDL